MDKPKSKVWILFAVVCLLLIIVQFYEFIVYKTFSFLNIGIMLLLLPSAVKNFITMVSFKWWEKVCAILAAIAFAVAISLRYIANAPF